MKRKTLNDSNDKVAIAAAKERAQALLDRASAIDADAASQSSPKKLAPIFGKQRTSNKKQALRIQPKPLHPLSEYAFRCTFAWGQGLARMLVRTAGLGDAAIIDFRQGEGLLMRQMEVTGTAMAELRLPPASWLTWYVPDENGCTRVFFYEELEMLAKLCKADHSLTLYATKDKPDVMWARMYNADSDRRLRLGLKTTDHLDAIPELPHQDWVYPYEVQLSASRFKGEIDACDSSKASLVEFTTGTNDAGANALVFTTFTDTTGHGAMTYQSPIPVDKVLRKTAARHNETDVVTLYSVTFLALLAKMHEVSSSVDVAFGTTNGALRLTFALCESSKGKASGEHQEDCLGTITTLLMGKESE